MRKILTVPMDQQAQQAFNFFGGGGQLSPAGFYMSKEIKAENLAASTARMFLGIRLECAQCHDHPFATWKREQFWGMAAFFAGLGVVFIRSMTAISATIFLVSINWTLITVKILENMTEVALGPAAAFSVFVIAVVLAVTALLNALLRRMTAPSLRVSSIGT